MSEEKALAVKDDYAVSSEFQGMFDSSLGSAGDTLDAEDLRIPKLTLVQAMTKGSFNTEGAAVGNYINSIEKNDMGNELEMFVMTDTKLWQFDYEVKKGKDVKKEYLTITDFEGYGDLRKNWKADALPPEVLKKMEAKEISFDNMLPPDLIYRFYVLLVDEVKAGLAFPYILDFKRSSAPEGNKLKNIFYKMKTLAKVPSYAKVFTLSSEFVQDEYDYYIKKCSSGRNIDKEELAAVEHWVKELSQNRNAYQDDESDNEAEGPVTVEAEVVDSSDGKPKF